VLDWSKSHITKAMINRLTAGRGNYSESSHAFTAGCSGDGPRHHSPESREMTLKSGTLTWERCCNQRWSEIQWHE